MTPRRARTVLLAVLIAGAAGCSLAIDSFDIDQGCGAGKKWCSGQCVDVNDPAYGCSLQFCDPKCQLRNAYPGCDDNHECYVQSCLKGFTDCGNGGCDKYTLADPDNCGECNLHCPPGQECIEGTCGVPILN